MYLFLFLLCFYFYLFAHMLVGDEFMDVLYIRVLLCVLECFSLLCRCLALFLRLFCNLLSSHFLLVLFFDFVYFLFIYIIFVSYLFFFSLFNLVFGGVFILFTILIFYLFLLCLDTFSALLQIFILINMVHLSVNDWCVLRYSV